jgi:hypothetical protein
MAGNHGPRFADMYRKAIGREVPAGLVLRADEVIE